MGEHIGEQIVVWPGCPQHRVAYVLRRVLSLNEGYVWLWQSDCPKRCTAQPVLFNDDGPLPAEDEQ